MTNQSFSLHLGPLEKLCRKKLRKTLSSLSLLCNLKTRKSRMHTGKSGRVSLFEWTEVLTIKMLFSAILIPVGFGSPDANRLYGDLMRDYNKLIRPVVRNTDILTIFFGIKFIQLINVDEVNQVITTNVIVRQSWVDYKLKWHPENYGGIEQMDVLSNSIWTPDIVLYNNADGNYHVARVTKATVRFTGEVSWDPPAIWKSYCLIDVQYFPYDKQSCEMKYGSWTYDGLLINLVPNRGYVKDNQKISVAMDLSEYKKSIEWDILEASAQRHTILYACCPEPYLDLTYTLVIRRKALFYTVNLISPCVVISFLTVFVFYLPCDSGEKVTLCISILLSLTVFFLLLAEIIPPTSLTIPLIGKYLLFTMTLVAASVVFTVLIINVHFRNPRTHTMQPWIRSLFLGILPKLLFMQRPWPDREPNFRPVNSFSNPIPVSDEASTERIPFSEGRTPPPHIRARVNRPQVFSISQALRRPNSSVQKATDGINYIVSEMTNSKRDKEVALQWKYMAMVLDRFFLYIFAVVSVAGFFLIILDAPSLYEKDASIPQICDAPVHPESDNAWLCLFDNEDV